MDLHRPADWPSMILSIRSLGELQMHRFKKMSKDHIGALLLLLMGAAVLAMGLSYKMGNLNRMGAGFIPVVLGVLMMAVGLAIGLTATPKGTVMTNPLPG